MSGTLIQPGDVVRLFFPYSSPPKRKICLCICLEEGLFLVVSSDPYRHAPADSQITIFKQELSCLEYDSVLDVSKAYRFDMAVIKEAIKGGVYRIADSALERIKFRVQGQGYLPREHKRLILDNF